MTDQNGFEMVGGSPFVLGAEATKYPRVVVCCDFCVLKATSTSLLKKQPQDLKTWGTKIPIEFLPRTLGKVKSIDEKVELNS